jgi:hypothetical protein
MWLTETTFGGLFVPCAVDCLIDKSVLHTELSVTFGSMENPKWQNSDYRISAAQKVECSFWFFLVT